MEPARVIEQGEHHITLATGEGRIELGALAPDLFRFRAAQGRAFAATPSWAVCKTDWPQHTSRIVRMANRVRITTGSGSLQMDLHSGKLLLLDGNQSALLQSQPAQSGFLGRSAQVALRLSGGESFLGLGESSGPFNRAGLIQEFWNTDALGHGGISPGLRSLYVSIPFTVMMRGERACGVFWDNPARQKWDLGQTDRHLWQLTAAGGEIDLYLFTGPSVADVVQRYTELTGRMPLPPRWAIGYHQCRYSYQSRMELEDVARKLRRRRIPCDALYLDIHHMDGFRVFTFGRTYPKPAEMIARLRRRGFHTVAIVNPGVKVDPRFGVYRRGKRIGAYIRAVDGQRDFVGRVWPGRSVFPDFLNPSVRRWWGREQGKLQRAGVVGFWNDMNEPASFIPPTKTIPEHCRHHTEHGLVRHSLAHNVYGMQMARASFDGSLVQQPDQRPFVITRAAYAGTQRHALVWTGDNASSWEHLADSVQMLLNLGLSGFPFCGGDAGGFLDNCTPELYARWLQLAAFTPFFRNHTMLGTVPHEPWCFGPEVESIVRSYIELRYQLLPYWYGLFAEAHRTGAPIMRPMVWDHQHDPVAAACGDQFLIGRSLLVAPVLHQGAVARSVYLPRGSWFEYWKGQRHSGGRHVVAEAPLARMPIYVRGGSILPMIPVRQHTGGPISGVVHLQLWPGGRGDLDWYEDDGESLGYTRGASHRRQVQWNGRLLEFGSSEGDSASRVKRWRVVMRNMARPIAVRGVHAAVRYHRPTRTASFEFQNTRGAFCLTVQ